MFELMKKWGPNKDLSLRKLSLKLASLLLLVSSQRGQIVINLVLDETIVEDTVTFKMKTLLKHNRLGDPLYSLVFRPFDECKRLCVVSTIRAYLRRTEFLRSTNRLLVSFYTTTCSDIKRYAIEVATPGNGGSRSGY